MHVVDLASAGGLVFHDDAHRGHLGFGVRAQPPHIQGFALRMRQDERARRPLDALQRDGALAAQLFAPSFPPCQNLGMAGFGLGETPLRAGDVVVQLLLGAPDFVVDPLQHFGQ